MPRIALNGTLRTNTVSTTNRGTECLSLIRDFIAHPPTFFNLQFAHHENWITAPMHRTETEKPFHSSHGSNEIVSSGPLQDLLLQINVSRHPYL